MWHHPIGREVKGYNPYSLHTRLVRQAQEGYANIDNGIHTRRYHNHQLWASEISSIESSIMSRNMAQIG